MCNFILVLGILETIETNKMYKIGYTQIIRLKFKFDEFPIMKTIKNISK